MKPIRIVLSPTRNRHLNLFLGLVLLLVSVLLLLALATWHAADPSLNTATDPTPPYPVHNWVGLFGSYLSDLLLQTLGLTAFLLPLWLGGIGWTWMRSRPSGSALLRWAGSVMALIFMPAVFGLSPWHWRWLHIMPVEGVVGRLISGLLVTYLNIQGAWLVAAVFAGLGLYFASAISYWVMKEALENRWLQLRNLYDRWKNWREERAEQREERDAERDDLRPGARSEDSMIAPPLQFATNSIPNSDLESEESDRRPGFFARLFSRGKRAPERDELDEVPAFRRAIFDQNSPGDAASAAPAEAAIPIVPQVRRTSIWERAEGEPAQSVAVPPVAQTVSRNVVPMQPAARVAEPRTVAQRPAPSQPVGFPFDSAPASTPAPAGEIAIHGRADAEVRSATVAPKNVSGFKLPPSTLLNAGEGPQKVREDELREEAKVLVEKCAEFDVRGQVVQINPGPMVTTYEFKPEAGVKYSRVTGLADDLCLAMRAESILIERMAGQEHGRHPGAESRARNHPSARRARERDVREGQVAPHARHGQGHQRPHRYRRPERQCRTC